MMRTIQPGEVLHTPTFEFKTHSHALLAPFQVQHIIDHLVKQQESYSQKKVKAQLHHEVLNQHVSQLNKDIKKSKGHKEISLSPEQIETLKTIVTSVLKYLEKIKAKKEKDQKISKKELSLSVESQVKELDLEKQTPVEVKNILLEYLEKLNDRVQQAERKKNETIQLIAHTTLQLEKDREHMRNNKPKVEQSLESLEDLPNTPKLTRRKAGNKNELATPSHEEHFLGDRVKDAVHRVEERVESIFDALKDRIGNIFHHSDDPTSPTDNPVKEKPVFPAAVFDALHKQRLPGVLKYDNEIHTLQDLESLPDPDNAIKSAYQNTKDVLKFWKDIFGLDFVTSRADSAVHFMRDYVNAFFDGLRMVYGDGNKYFKAFFLFLGIAGHEMGHALVGDKLNYYAESGALNEHYADVLGACTEMHTNHASVSDYHWLIGPDLIQYKGVGYALRTFLAGPAYTDVAPLGGTDPQPDTMPDASWFKRNKELLESDEGGVHILSKIPNRVFHMVAMAQGDWKVPVLFWKRVLDRIEDPNINFADFATLQLKIAAEEGNQELVHQLSQAWSAVGVKPTLSVHQVVVEKIEEKLEELAVV